MTLIENWKAICQKAWSMRFVFIGLALGAAEQFVPALQGSIDNRLYLVLLALVGISRVIHQESVSGDQTRQ